MDHLLIVSTVIELGAVVALAWFVRRTGRTRAAAVEEQRGVLESLRGDLTVLIRDAEQRTRALDETLGARERHLRALLHELGRAEVDQRAGTRGRAERDADWAAATAEPVAPAPRDGGARGLDPAEARLLHDLEVRLPRRTA